MDTIWKNKPDPNKKLIFKKKFKINKKIPILGNIARFHPQKDHKNLLNALYLLKKEGILFKCILVGYKINNQNRILNNIIRKFNLIHEIKLLGSQTNINQIMNGIDINILSSKYGEAFPNVVAEAMASGTPCVVTDVGDASIIVDKTGWTTKPNNPHSLAKGIKKALISLNTNNWKNKCIKARKRVHKFYNINQMIENYRLIWKSVLIKNKI